MGPLAPSTGSVGDSGIHRGKVPNHNRRLGGHRQGIREETLGLELAKDTWRLKRGRAPAKLA